MKISTNLLDISDEATCSGSGDARWLREVLLGVQRCSVVMELQLLQRTSIWFPALNLGWSQLPIDNIKMSFMFTKYLFSLCEQASFLHFEVVFSMT